MTVELRPMTEKDFPKIESIIKSSWRYEDFCSPKVANKLAKSFLAGCLTDYTDSQVAIVDNKLVGVIFLKNSAIHRTPFKYRLKQLKTMISMMLNKEARNVASVFSYVEVIDKKLLKEAGHDYAGELSLFAVDETCQGQGVGKKLFQYAMTTFQEQQVDNFYLYTDTTCNYGFYDYHGMTKRAEMVHHFTQLAGVEPTTFFLYDYDFKQKDAD